LGVTRTLQLHQFLKQLWLQQQTSTTTAAAAAAAACSYPAMVCQHACDSTQVARGADAAHGHVGVGWALLLAVGVDPVRVREAKGGSHIISKHLQG
jgi:hypothetical protein